MMKLPLFAALIYIGKAAAVLEEVFAWKELDFDWPNDEFKNDLVKSGEYVAGNNLPLGVDRWKDKLFVTVPRWKSGVAASLNYIPLNSTDKSPKLVPYPDWKANILPKKGETPEENHIVSTFRLKVDSCDRLWVMETGLADILGEPSQISPPAIVIFDLKTDKVIRRYNLKGTDIKGDDSFFANIVVDVTKDTCDKAFAYVPDLGGYGLVVYSFADNNSWRIKHNYFYFDPLHGDLTVGGVNFQWTDGVFGLALGPPNENGFRTVYFHALASTNEFSVNTQVLRNESLATDPHSYELFKLEGNKGENTQSTASVFDEKTNVLFLTQIQKDGVACWNPRRKLEPANVGIAVHHQENLIFTNDIAIDSDRNLWILSDKMPAFVYKGLDPLEINYRILKIGVDEAINGTRCVA
ncbi:yellow-c [Leptinotarsa decemlineata]|uniref:yellow-c n=1 Tax=Leptinotarsa decemlineata TaxID=7539 RepID=UPI003D305EE8